MFAPRSIRLQGGFRLLCDAPTAFVLFSPLGEKAWVPGWEPELLHPPGATWERGLLFRTLEERGEAIWFVTALDPEAHEVEYQRVEAGRYVARVSVRCRGREGGTDVAVSYEFVGLSETGNADITGMSQAAFEEKMQRWERWIGAHLARSRGLA